jgi:hypothetical protein
LIPSKNENGNIEKADIGVTYLNALRGFHDSRIMPPESSKKDRSSIIVK